MYDYRRMTKEEREAVVTTRRACGFPLHKPPHPEQGDGWYMVNAATYEHRHHFSKPLELTALERRLLEALAGAKLACSAWVVLPNHYHVLVRVRRLSELGRALGAVHGRSGRYANVRDATPGRQVWYKYSDRKIRSEAHFWASLHYIVFNPVKHGYVKEPADWPWSCYEAWLASRGARWLDDLMRRYPLYEFGAKWDSPE